MIRAQLSMIGVVGILALSPTGWADSSKAETVILVGTEYGFAPNRCGIGSCGVPRPSLDDYVTGTEATSGVTTAGGSLRFATPR